ncbi:MAG: PDZ domain-containing protein, partial [Armatimonadota bacterium]
MKMALVILALLLIAAAALAAPVTVYVSPTGNDAASGLKPETPVATLAKAQEIARAARQGSAEGYKLVLRGGSYYLPATLAFGPEDSGTEQAPTQVVPFKGETVRLVAGRDLRKEAWQPWQGEIKQ